MVTRTARATYYIAICVFLIFLAVLIVKMTFWPVCISGSTCDGWTVAGLVAAVLGVSTAFLGILGALALAAWWTSLDKRVEDRVTQLFNTRIQAVQDSIDQLEKRAGELRDKVVAIENTIPDFDARIQAAQGSINQLDKQADELRGEVNAIESTVSGLEPRIDAAFEATSPGYLKQLEYQRKLNEINARPSQETR
jgi:septal ring factor EnvC (AmiA/AmiB activator)